MLSSIYIYICFLHIIIIFFVLSDDTSWSSRYSIRPRSRNLWVGVSAGVHFLLISAAESVKTWVRKVQLLIDEVQECWTCILSCFIFTFICYIFFYFVFSRFVQSFLVYSLFSLPYILWLSINIYIYIHIYIILSFFLWSMLPGFYTSVFCLSSSSLFPRACCQESCIQIQADFARFYEEATQRKRANFTHPKPAVLTQCLTEVAHHFLSVSCGQTKRSTSRK